MPDMNAVYGTICGIVVVAMIFATVYAYYTTLGTTAIAGVTITLYAGPVTGSSTKWGFGNSSTTIISPGPSLTFHVNDTVGVTLDNSDSTMPHGWQIVNSLSDLTVQFGATIGPINAGASAAVIFTITKAGNFTYICQVPGHIQLGMWGNVSVLEDGT